MRHRFLIPFLLTVLSGPFLFCQNEYNLRQFGNESVDFLKQPTKWEGNDWLRLGLVGAGTLLAMQIDQPVHDAVMKDQAYYNSPTVKIGNMWGEIYATAIIGGGFGLHGLLSENNSTKKVGFEILQAACYSGATTTLLKAIVGRARPYTGKGMSRYQPFTILDDGFHSLPSGHTTLAFALSTVLAKNTQSGVLRVLAYLPAAMTLFARVEQDYHWTSDCLLSAVIGYAVASWVTDLHDQKDSPVRLSSIYPLSIKINLN